MGAGTTWTGGLSSDRPEEKGPRSGPMEHSGSSGPSLQSPTTCLGQGWAWPPAQGTVWGQRLSSQAPLSPDPWVPSAVICTLAFRKSWLPTTGGPQPQTPPILWNRLFLKPFVKELDLPDLPELWLLAGICAHRRTHTCVHIASTEVQMNDAPPCRIKK